MTIRETTQDDPVVRRLLGLVGLPERFDEEHTEVIVLGEEAGEPIGFVSGLVFFGEPVIEHIGVRPEHRSRQRARALADAFVETMARRGYAHVLSRVVLARPHAPMVRAMLEAWPARCYFAKDGIEWWIREAPATSVRAEGAA